MTTSGTSRQLNDAQRTTSPAGSSDGARAVSPAGSRHGSRRGSPCGAPDRSTDFRAARCDGGSVVGSTARRGSGRAPGAADPPPAGTAPPVAGIVRSAFRAFRASRHGASEVA
ncbi:hypothetical protein [Streptomyces sp. NPDC056672]|uniref:hypothetical protein n=1 Tax=Streptomyces sp. NPDC056672 TaxID=3345906 RepID=UPI00367E4491